MRQPYRRAHTYFYKADGYTLPAPLQAVDSFVDDDWETDACRRMWLTAALRHCLILMRRDPKKIGLSKVAQRYYRTDLMPSKTDSAAAEMFLTDPDTLDILSHYRVSKSDVHNFVKKYS